ncbi:hypothetical protein TOC8171_48790 [Pseudomonas syringae]
MDVCVDILIYTLRRVGTGHQLRLHHREGAFEFLKCFLNIPTWPHFQLDPGNARGLWWKCLVGLRKR